jgi:restriction endonuclease Mrr
VDDLRQTLEGIYDEQWYANVPFEGGEALHEGDASGYVDEIVEREDITAFFAQFGKEPEGKLIVRASDLLKAGGNKILRLDVEDINDELITYLVANPEKMRQLQPRKFEELIAELFKHKGYDVQLTPRTRDGGYDVYAIRRDVIGTALVIVECKRYAADNKVGVEIVRGLYGVVGQKNATQGVIATTSYFSRDAKDFYNDVKFRLGLADYDALCTMLKDWKSKKS